MKFIAAHKGEQNEAVVDPWTAVHFGVGLAFGLVGAPFVASMASAVAYDVGEQLFERSELGQKVFNTSGPESWGNVAGDLVAFGVGWWLGTRWNDE